jgi:hypothetical protein
MGRLAVHPQRGTPRRLAIRSSVWKQSTDFRGPTAIPSPESRAIVAMAQCADRRSPARKQTEDRGESSNSAERFEGELRGGHRAGAPRRSATGAVCSPNPAAKARWRVATNPQDSSPL